MTTCITGNYLKGFKMKKILLAVLTTSMLSLTVSADMCDIDGSIDGQGVTFSGGHPYGNS